MWGIAWLLSIPKKDFSTIVNTKAGQWRVSVNCAYGGFRCWMARLKSKSHRLESLIMRVVYWYHFSYKTQQEKPVTITWIGTWEACICSLAGLVKNLWAEEEYFLQPYWAPWQDFLMLVMTWHEFWCWICAGEDTRNAGLACPRPSRTAISKWTSHLSTWLWKQSWAGTCGFILSIFVFCARENPLSQQNSSQNQLKPSRWNMVRYCGC